MAIHTWPSSDVMTALEVESARFRLARKRESSRNGVGRFTKDLAPTVWVARVQSVPLYHDRAEQIMALIESMEDSLASFYVWNPAIAFPQADPDGSILGASTPTIHTVNGDNKRIRIENLPPAYVLTRGDKIEAEYLSPVQRAIYAVVDEQVVADGSGVTPLFEVSPHIRLGLTAGDAVNLIRPKVAMKIIEGTLDCMTDGAVTSRIVFETEEQPNENL